MSNKKHKEPMVRAGYLIKKASKEAIDKLAIKHTQGNASKFVDDIFLDVIDYHKGSAAPSSSSKVSDK